MLERKWQLSCPMCYLQALFLTVICLICPISWGQAFLSAEDQKTVEGVQLKYGLTDTDALVAADLAFRRQLQSSRRYQIMLTPGFFTPEDSAIPSAVSKAAQSVFQLIAFPKGPVDINYTWDLGSVLHRIKFYTQHASPETRVRGEIAKVYYDVCVREKKDECFIPVFATSFLHVGSAFVTGPTGTEILTSQHFFQNLKAQFRKTHCSPGKMRHCESWMESYDFFLVNSVNQVVADPVNNPLRLVDIGTTDQRKDFAKLKSVQPVGPGLVLAKQYPIYGEKLFNIGFPACTGCLESFNPEIPGLSQLLRGTRYPHRDSVEGLLQITFGPLVVAKKAPGLIVTAADGVSGMSGGVTVNSNGEALGILIGVNAEDIAGQNLPDRYSYSVPLITIGN